MATITVNSWLVFGQEYIENTGNVDQTLRLDEYTDQNTWETKTSVVLQANTRSNNESLEDGIYRWGVPNIPDPQQDSDYTFYIWVHYPKLADCISNYKDKLDDKFLITLFFYLSETSEVLGNLTVPFTVPDLNVLTNHKKLLNTLLSQCEECERYCIENPNDCNPSSTTFI